MDNTTQNQTTDTRDEQALIDIFYLDSYRLNSLISQLNNGALQAVTTMTENSQGSILSTHQTDTKSGAPVHRIRRFSYQL